MELCGTEEENKSDFQYTHKTCLSESFFFLVDIFVGFAENIFLKK